MSLLNIFQFLIGQKYLITAFERTIELLKNSEDSDWSSLTAGEIAEILNKELVKIKNNQKFDKVGIAVLFAPTGNIQEIAMQNDWNKEYFKVSTIIDIYTR